MEWRAFFCDSLVGLSLCLGEVGVEECVILKDLGHIHVHLN